MQFDYFDKKIKEAAENHHPAYDEKAWNKMENLLDKHMPEKKDRRRFIFFLLFFLLLGGGAAYFLIDKPWKTNNTIASTEKKTDQTTSSPIIENKPQQGQSQPNVTITNNNSNEQISNKKNENNLTQNNINQPRVSVTPEKRVDLAIKKPQVDKVIVKSNIQPKEIEPTNSLIVSSDNKISKDVNKNNNNRITPSDDQTSSVLNNNNNIITKNENTVTQPVNDNSSIKNEEKNVASDKNTVSSNVVDTNKKDEIVKNEQQQKKNTGKNKQKGNFAFTALVGPDVSKARSSDFGKINWNYGAGVSYTLKKFTLRSGFYVAKKVYTADASDYKLEYTLPPTIKFLDVNANCKVYEIPVSVAYNFASNKKSSWFASLGLSSYLMKSEKYQNWYKNTTTGSTYPRNFQYSGKNHHYFSVLDLSAGYTYKINNTFSLSAEPYFKLPLSGIGEGKVHLNSAGVLFSIGIKPFKAKSK